MTTVTIESTAARIRRVLSITRTLAETAEPRKLRYRLEELDCMEGYAEPGHSCHADTVVMANWNDVEGDERKTMSRLESIFERLGCGVEWSDEWVRCDRCQKAFRTQGDSYGWTMHGSIIDCECICGDCIKSNHAAEYLERLINNPRQCDTILGATELEALGFEKINTDEYYSGLHSGMTDNPQAIFDIQRKFYAEIVFLLDSASQFHIEFSAYGRNPESEKEW